MMVSMNFGFKINPLCYAEEESLRNENGIAQQGPEQEKGRGRESPNEGLALGEEKSLEKG